ncbi:MAG TPA: dihydroorotase, partial [Patescibacteria group bacterium]|nr:dihydroorotase [Patescibacteria group bacterium]
MLRLKYVQLPDGRIRDIVIEDGKIVRIEQCSRREKKEGPHRVFPGLIDPHVHDRTPGAEHKETVEHMTDAAIHGG